MSNPKDHIIDTNPKYKNFKMEQRERDLDRLLKRVNLRQYYIHSHYLYKYHRLLYKNLSHFPI